MRLPILTLAMSLALAGSAHAEHWVWFKLNGGGVAIDEDTAALNPDTKVAVARTLVFYATPREIGGGAYSFMAESLEFECNTQRYRWQHSAVYDLDGKFLTARPDSPWTDITAQSGSTGFIRLALCSPDKPTPTGDAATLSAMIETVRAAFPATQTAVAANPPPSPTPASAAIAAALANPTPPATSPPPAATTPAAAPAAGAGGLDLNALARSLGGQ